jgi:plasmid stabilization system protein ParE
MTFKVIVEPEAASDLDAAFRWYEEQLPGLGHEFLISVEACFSRLERDPEMYQAVDKRVRRARVDRFPFGLFYVISVPVINVLAAFHSRRDPEGWRKRVRKWD